MKYELDENKHPLEVLVVSGKLDEARKYIQANDFYPSCVSYALWNRNHVEDALFLIKEATSSANKAKCLARAFENFMFPLDVFTNSQNEHYDSFMQLLNYLKEEMTTNPDVYTNLLQEYPFNNLDKTFVSLVRINSHQIFTELEKFFDYMISPKMASEMLFAATDSRDHNQPEIVEKLLVLGGNPFSVRRQYEDDSIAGLCSDWMTTPLHKATVNLHLEKIKFLVEAGAPVNSKCNPWGTPIDELLHRIESSHSFHPLLINKNPHLVQVIVYLLEKGAIPKKPASVITALTERVMYRHLNCTTTDCWKAPKIPETFDQCIKLLADKGLQHEAWLYVCVSKLYEQQLAIKEGKISLKQFRVDMEVEMLNDQELHKLADLVNRLKLSTPQGIFKIMKRKIPVTVADQKDGCAPSGPQ